MQTVLRSMREKDLARHRGAVRNPVYLEDEMVRRAFGASQLLY